jgi:hypothetical protein
MLEKGEREGKATTTFGEKSHGRAEIDDHEEQQQHRHHRHRHRHQKLVICVRTYVCG